MSVEEFLFGRRAFRARGCLTPSCGGGRTRVGTSEGALRCIVSLLIFRSAIKYGNSSARRVLFFGSKKGLVFRARSYFLLTLLGRGVSASMLVAAGNAPLDELTSALPDETLGAASARLAAFIFL